MAKKIINIRLDEDLWRQAKTDAARQGLTLQEWHTLAIILRLDNSRIEIREDDAAKQFVEANNGTKR